MQALEVSAPITVRDWYYAMLEARGDRLRPQTLKTYNQQVRNGLADVMDRKLESISSDEAQELYASLRRTGKRGKANMSLRVLRLIFNYAGCFQTIHNPVKRLGVLRLWEQDPRRETYIKPTQIKAFWEALHVHLQPVVRDWFLIALLTGLRHQEIMTLKKEQIDLDERVLIIPPERAKNHKRHVVPLSDYVLMIVKRRMDEAEGIYLFPGRFPNTHASTYRDDTKATGFRFLPHDMRRTFLTIGNLAGVDMLTLKRLVNHACQDVTTGYIVNDLEILRKPQQAVTNKILELAGVRKQEEKQQEVEVFGEVNLTEDVSNVVAQSIRSLKHKLQVAMLAEDFAKVKEVSEALEAILKTQQALTNELS